MHRRKLSTLRAPGFTLVEVLVSLTVLSLIVVLVSSIVGTTSNNVSSGGRRIDADSHARLVFNRIGNDLAQMVKRSDMDYALKNPAFLMGSSNVGVNDQMAFIASVPGLVDLQSTNIANLSNFSLVAYILREERPYFKGMVFERLTQGILSSEIPYLPILLTGASDAKFPGLLPSPTVTQIDTTYDDFYQVVGSNVFRFEYVYLLKATDTEPAAFSITPWRGSSGNYNGLKDVAAIVVAIAVLDDDGRQKVSSYDNLVQALPNATNNMDILSRWLPVINGGSFASAAGVPQGVAASVKIYQRYFYLNTGNH